MPKYDLDAVINPDTAHPDDAHSILIRLIPPNNRVFELGWATGYCYGCSEDYGIMDRTHLRMYTEKTGRALLDETGYTVEKLPIAGSDLQNLLNARMRHANRSLPAPLFPGLLGYEVIYIACRD